MPVVIVKMWEGRTAGQKRRLVRAITDAGKENGRRGDEAGRDHRSRRNHSS